jgi:hypothetical protein
MRRPLVCASLGLLVVVAPLLFGCGDRPSLTSGDISAMSFNLFSGSSTPITRAANSAEVERFVRAYSEASDYDKTAGTTHPIRVDIVLKSGSSLVVWGGDVEFQTVLGTRQWNIASADLDAMLSQIAAELRPQP